MGTEREWEERQQGREWEEDATTIGDTADGAEHKSNITVSRSLTYMLVKLLFFPTSLFLISFFLPENKIKLVGACFSYISWNWVPGSRSAKVHSRKWDLTNMQEWRRYLRSVWMDDWHTLFKHKAMHLTTWILGMQRYHFFRTDPIRYRKFWGSADTNPIRSSLFCVLNTIYYSVSQLVGQKCWVCSPKVGCETVLRGLRIVYSQRNNINKKRNSKCFSDARLLF